MSNGGLYLVGSLAARNEITHDKPLPPTEGSRRFLQSYLRTLREIKDMSTEHILKGKLPLIYSSFQAPRTLVKVSPPDKPWLKPPAGWVKLTIDGSFRAEDGNAGLGMVLRDEEGAVIFSASEFVPSCREALGAELLACSVGLDLALQHTTLPIVIDTDCSQLVTVVRQDRSPYLHLVFEIKRSSSNGGDCNFVKVDRGQVRVSHVLANLARTEHHSSLSFGFGPEVFLRELERERLVNPIVQ
jgi:ribonuclease HI